MSERLPRSFWASPSWRRGGAQLVDDDLHRLGNVLHYPGRASPFGELSLDELRSTIRGWWDWHVHGRGWSDIGYQTAIDQTGRVIELRGISRVPAAHASASNPRANWHGGATLLIIGNDEEPSAAMIEAYRWYRHEVWLARWPTATGVTHHRLVPGAQTSCAGDHVHQLIRSGELAEPPRGGTIMAWNEDLSRESRGAKITPMADDYLPDSWGRDAAQLLGYAAMGSTQARLDYAAGRFWSRDNPTLGMSYGAMLRYVLNAVRPDRSQTPGARIGFLQDLDALSDKLDTVLSLLGGADTDTILAELRENREQARTAAEQLDASVDDLAAQMDAMSHRMADVVELLESYQSGQLDAEQVVQRMLEVKAAMFAEAAGSGE